MAFDYEIKTKKSGVGDKTSKYYAVPVWKKEIGTEELSNIISERCTLTEADVLAVLVALSGVMEEYLHDGHSVRLDRIGRFRLSVTSDGKDTSEQITSKQVRVNKICFMADKRLKRRLGEVQFKKKSQ